MADNTSQTGTDTLATGDVTTLNGGVSSGIKVERVKVGYGDDGTYRDASAAFPLPSYTPNATQTGTISALNATPTAGAGTANSSVTITVPDNHSAWTLTLGGTFSAGTTLAFQASLDGTTWWYTNGRRNLDVLGSNESVSMTSTDVQGGASPAGGNPSLWKGTVGAVRYLRVTCTAYTAADSITVSMMTSPAVGGTFLLASLPSGTSNIGALHPTPAYTIGTATGTTAATTGQIGRPVRVSGNVAQATAATLIAAPAAGSRIYVTGLQAANEGSALTVLRLFAGALPAAAGAVAVTNDVYDFPMAGLGGGAQNPFSPTAPWPLPAATALSFAVTIATTWYCTVNYYVST
jgi:hypothetical protein